MAAMDLPFGGVSKQDVLERRVQGISVKIKDGNIGVLYLAMALSAFHHQRIFNTVNVQTGKFSPCFQVRQHDIIKQSLDITLDGLL
ncbi:L-asparaginase II [Penicillium hordei]|uniref:L-asparaginase II n=1 Tax=Penicillium hordei TaxID=40994 RepID=A0AAD6H9R5_9EURO|nr:L-asparaginase II [Penicillium hordei]KAJ5618166.1 L-asparaginase II [Penicillium hordei]